MNRCLFAVLVGALIFVSFSTFAQGVEICNDNKDNNGDTKIDCLDTYCIFPANVEKGCRCFDNIDNDGDGKIDPSDGDCATYYGLSFIGKGSTCSITPPNGGAPFSTSAPQTTQQNTADTPAKVVVGDINGDGVPDAAVTSKWNSTIQVIATAAASGFAVGDIMSDFRTPGSKIFPGSGSGYVFEYEIMIADIDKDKKAELFAIASHRGGSPNNAPDGYFLTGFKYVDKDLVPLWDAVDLGSDRPGAPGIADFDGDGKAEIYLKNRIYAAESGVKLADPGGDWDKAINAGPVAANITGDSKLELICGNLIYSVPSLSGRVLTALTLIADMNSLAGADFYPKGFNDLTEYGKDNASSTSTADFDGDGFLDVLMTGAINCSGLEASPCGTNKTTIFYWNFHNGTVQTFFPPDTSTPNANGWLWGTGRINLGDATGDGKLDALFIAGNQLYCLGLNAGGNLTQQWVRTINDSKSGILALTVYDFNNDGKPEVVYRDAAKIFMVDGQTGATELWSQPCESHTWTEGPVIADVNGDGGTDICVTCYTNTSFDINAGIQQQSLGQTRLYFSATKSWLPTRKVWNQHPYYVTNINDDLTLPYPQVDPALIFSTGACANGLPGPQRPLNLFMNQVPNLNAQGCPVFPAPDLTFKGDDPANPGVDSDGDGSYVPTVVVTPPICGDLVIKAYFNIINNGELAITDVVPVSFFNGNPTLNPATATRLLYDTIKITNLQVGQTKVTRTLSITGPGTVFDLYIVLYNDGSVLPISLTGQSTKECSISNNMYKVTVTPDPFSTTITKTSDNFKCANSAPNTGELKAHIFKGATEFLDYSQYAFQWYTGVGTGSPIAAPAGTGSSLTGVAEGTYTLVVTNTAKGCKSSPINMSLVRLGNDPTINITVLSNQTVCTPANGKLQADVVGGNTGYTFTWFNVSLTPLGITGTVANGLVAGSYVVSVSKSGCTKTSAPVTVAGPQIPDAQAVVLQHVVDCANLSSGSVKADAYFNGVLQNPANYTFNWYFYNNATSTRGSVLPAGNGTGQTRTGLAIGYYQAEIKEIATGCFATTSPVVQVTDSRGIPTANITELAPQTACDPTKQNGVLFADALIGGVVQNPAGFTFQWFKGNNTLPANLHTTVSGTSGQQANKVTGGGIYYTVKVTSGNNCSNTNKFIISENTNVPVVTLTPTDNSICDPAIATYNGAVTASTTFAGSPVAVPDANYTYAWHKGSLATDPAPSPNSTTNVLSQQNGGNYTLVVTRTDLGCVSLPKTAPVANVTVNPVITSTPTPSTHCAGGSPNGTMSATVGGVTAGYTFQWYAGNSTASPVVPVASGGSTANAFNLTGGGNFTVKVINSSSGCVNTQTTALANQSAVPIITLVQTPNSICDALLTSPSVQFNGTVTASATYKGSPVTDFSAYSFEWHNGKLLTSPLNSTSTTKNLNNLQDAFYTVKATIAGINCVSAAETIEVKATQVIPVVNYNFIESSQCAGPPNGSADASVQVGAGTVTAGYKFEWFSGESDDLSDPTVTVVPPSHGGNTPAIFGVQGSSNDYTVRVTNNATGCKMVQMMHLHHKPADPKLTTTEQDNSGCTVFDGSITATIDMPGPATYYWYTGNVVDPTKLIATTTTNVLTGQQAGNFTVYAVEGTTQCPTKPVKETIKNDLQVFPTVTTTSTPSVSCAGGSPNGTTTASASGAVTGGYSYQWYAGTAFTAGQEVPAAKGGTLVTTNSLASGNYIVQVTINTTGCKNTSAAAGSTIAVANSSVLPVLGPLSMTQNTSCTAVGTGTASIGTLTFPAATNVPSPYTGFTFKWLDAASVNKGTTTTATALVAGTYSLTATHTVTNCISNPVTIAVTNNQDLPDVTTSITPSTNCVAGKENGQARVLTVDGTAVGTAVGYTYAWTGPVAPAFPVNAGTNTSNTSQVIKVQGGPGYNYTIVVTNSANGCQTSTPLNVTDGKVLPTITLATVDNGICNPGLTVPSKQYSGKITATVTNLIAPLTDYTFAFGAGMNAGVATANVYDQLNGGVTAYSATTTHVPTGCVSTAVTATIANVLSPPVLTTSITPSTNCVVGKENGQARVVTVDGVAVGTATGYTYAWTGPVAPSFPVNVATNTSNTAQVIKVQGGVGYNYTVVVTNQGNGCQTSPAINVSDGKVLPVITLAALDNGICNPLLTAPPKQYSGKITATVTNMPVGGVLADYTFAFGAGMGPGVATANVYDQLNGGVTAYSATTTHVPTGCVSTAVTATIANVLSPPVLTTSITPSTNCVVGKENGQARVVTVDGVAVGTATGYTYAWTGPVAPSFPVNVATNTSNTAQVIKVQGGVGYNYTVVVTNQGNGCQTSPAINVSDGKVLPVITLAALDNGICNPALTLPPKQYSGKITATVTNIPAGGVLADYTFAFGAGMGPGVATANVYDQLNGGVTAYSATTTHVPTGCVSAPVAATIANVLTLPVLTTSITPSTNCVAGKENGQARVLTVDGVAVGLATGYTYAWTGPVAPSFPVNVATNTSNTAQVIKVQGGAGYNYTIVVTNQANGCQTSPAINVSDAKVLPIITLATVDNGVCNPALTAPPKQYSGKITATVTNLIVPLTDYTFAFGAGMGPGVATANVYDQLNGGATAYSATTTHVPTGCVSSPVNATVANVLALPVLITSTTPSTNCVAGKEDGQARVVSVDGNASPAAGYTYAWTGPVAPSFPVNVLTNASDTYQVIKVQGGAGYNYTVVVTNQNTGCQETKALLVGDAKVLPVLTLAKTDNTGCSAKTGTASVNTLTYQAIAVGSPYVGYSFSWNTAATTPTINTLPAGSYTLTTTKTSVGCTSIPVSVTVIDNTFIPPINIVATPQTSCDVANLNGILAATVDESSLPGGSGTENGADYLFVWHKGNQITSPVVNPPVAPPAPNGVINKLAGNLTYLVEATKISTGCANTKTMFLPETVNYPVVTFSGNTPVTTCGTPNGALQANVDLTPVQTYTYYWMKEDVGVVTTSSAAVMTDVNGSPAFPNRKNIGLPTTKVDNFNNMIPGDYTIVVQDDYSKCISQPVTATVAYNVVASNISVTLGPVLPSTCGTLDGEMTANVSGGTGGTYSIVLYKGGPTNSNINFFDNPPVFAGTPIAAVDPATTLHVGPPGNGLETFTYTFLVYDNGNGCGNYKTIFLPFQDPHTLAPSVIPSTTCLPAGNGQISVLVGNIPDGSVSQARTYEEYVYRLYSGENARDNQVPPQPLTANQIGASIGPGSSVPSNPFVFTTPLPPGKYTIEVQQAFGGGCPVFEVVEVLQTAFPPLVDIVGALTANTACDVLKADGSADIDIQKVAGDVAPGTSYTLDVTPDPGNGTGYPLAGLGTGPQTIGGLQAASAVPTYTIKVTSNKGCVTQRDISIPDQQSVATLVGGNFIVSDAAYCSPSGSVEVTSISIIGAGLDNIKNFLFDWYSDITLATNVRSAQGDDTATKGGEVLDNTTFATIGPGSYWVVAKKNAVGQPGFGCTSAPFKADIADVHVNPDVVLTPFTNTACDNSYEGKIQVQASDSGGPGAVVGTTYTYVWDLGNPLPAIATTVNNDGDGSGADGDGDNPLGLKEGDYKVVVTNNVTSCPVTAQTTLLQTATPIVVLNAGHTDQDICAPDGSITIGPNDVTVNGAPDAHANFSFEWSVGSAAAPPVVTGIGTSTLNIGNLATIGAGDYFVTATRKPGVAIGSGCKSAPLKVTISDVAIKPTVLLTPFSNTACDTKYEGKMEVRVSETGIGSGQPYNYVWDPANPITIPNTINNDGNGVNNGDGDNPLNLQEGTYKITVTNSVTFCSTLGQATLLQTTTPIVVANATAVNRFICAPDGSITVNSGDVTVNSVPDPLNTNFVFDWFAGSPTGTNVLSGNNQTALTPATFPTIAPGDYYVVATRATNVPLGSGCKSAPLQRTILDKSVKPTVLLTPFSNTACDTKYEGKMEVRVSETGIGSGQPYNYVWDPANPITIPNTINNDGNGVNNGDGDNPLNLQEGTYKITVTNSVTFCSTLGQATLLQTTTPIVVANATVFHQLICAPDGSIIVNSGDVTVNGVPDPLNTNFVFDWFAGSPTGTNVLSGNNQTALNTVTFPTIAPGDYYVVATRATNVPVGSGCKSAPLQRTILDKRVTPTISFTTVSSTACDGNFDGKITVTGNTAGMAGVGYNYVWTNDPDGAGAAYFATNSATNNTLGSFSTLNTDKIGAISATVPGQYSIRVTNFATQCFADGTVDILKTTIPMAITTVNTLNRDFCSTANGSAQVTTIAETPGPGATANYSYTWSSNADMSSPFVNVTDTQINLDFGTYYVLATKGAVVSPATPGVSGSGCSTSPLPFTILDKRVTPTISFTTVSSTACDGNFDGKITVTASVASGPGFGPLIGYNYVWTSDPDGAGGAYFATNSPTNNTLGAFSTLPTDKIGAISATVPGQYAIRATNSATQCFVDGTVDILKTTIPMAITTVTTANRDFCSTANGSAQVTTIAETPGPGATANYSYTWSSNADMSSPFVNVTDTQINLDFGTYYVLATKGAVVSPATPGVSGSGCSTSPLPFTILDKRIIPTITFSTISSTSCDNNFDGQITINASTSSGPGAVGGATYDYLWTANPGAPVVVIDALNAPNTHVTGGADVVGPGNYSFRVRNFITKCFTDASTTLLQTTIPIGSLSTSATPLDVCTPLPVNGSGTVTAISSGVLTDFTYTWDDDPQMGSPFATNTAVFPPTQSSLGAGTYYVYGTFKAIPPVSGSGSGSGCKTAPVSFTVLDKRVNPRVKLTSFENTACDGNYEGSIQTDVTTATGPGAPADYSYVWTSTSATLPAANPTAAGTELISALQEGTYTLTATNNITKCVSDDLATITVPIDLIHLETVSVIDQKLCSADGSITVTDVSIDEVSDAGNLTTKFTYTWYKNDVVTVIPGATGSTLDIASYPTIAAGTYYVKAIRNAGAGPGSGCETDPFKVEIKDIHVDPTVSFSNTVNTSCDNNFDAKITVTPNTSVAPGAGANYDLVWTTVPAGSTVADALNVPQAAYSTAAPDVVGAGTFTLRATNRTTQCFVDGQTIVVNNPQPVDILTVNSTNQLICYPDGSIAVNTVSVGATANYSYNWFKNDPNTSALVDAGNATITVPNLSTANYTTMAAGTFYVVATKNALTPGGGCVTPPFRIDIKDLHKDPRSAMTFTPNSSCDNLNPNATILANASEQSGATTDTYSFAWTLNGTPLPPVTTVSNTTNSSQLANAFDGSYVLTIVNTSATGCQSSASLDVNINLNVSFPNIINVSTTDPIDCFPTGTAAVNSVSIGGGPAITGAALTTDFVYEWYPGNFVPPALPTTTPNIVGLAPQSYFVLVQDNFTKCKSGPTEVKILDTSIIYPVVDILQTAKQISCIAVTGTAALAATGDGQDDTNPNYTFTWYPTLDITGTAFATTSTISNLMVGNYSVDVKNLATNCSSFALYIVPNDAPAFTPRISGSAQPRTLCVGMDGSVLVRVVDIDPAYPFPLSYTADLYTGNLTSPSGPPTFPNVAPVPGFATNFNKGGLQEGFYTYRVTDNNTGCFAIDAQEVLDQRTKPVIVIVEEQPLTNCDPAIANGQLGATADGGLVGGYTFDWYAGTTVSAPPGVLLVSNDRLTARGKGDYVVRVTRKVTGCFADKFGTITEKTLIPPVPTPKVVQHRTNCVTPNGWVSATVGGETFNYKFDWFDGGTATGGIDKTSPDYQNVDIGPYTVIATDKITGCVSPPGTVVVEDKRITPEFTFVTTPSYCSDTGKPKGAGSIAITLITKEVTFDVIDWTDASGANVGSGVELLELFPGFYTANTTTTEGCTNSGTAEVKTEIGPYNGMSVNGDAQNDSFIIDCISLFPNNNVKIFNRSGIKVYEIDGYNNAEFSFKGLGEKGLYLQGAELPVGTYFYIIDKRDGSKPVAGYLELTR